MVLGLIEDMIDREIEHVNKYIAGEHVMLSRGTRRERENVTAIMMMLIEKACGIHTDGIEVGIIYPAMYKREKRRREKYWKRVNAGEITDTRRGYEKYRRTES